MKLVAMKAIKTGIKTNFIYVIIKEYIMPMRRRVAETKNTIIIKIKLLGLFIEFWQQRFILWKIEETLIKF